MVRRLVFCNVRLLVAAATCVVTGPDRRNHAFPVRHVVNYNVVELRSLSHVRHNVLVLF